MASKTALLERAIAKAGSQKRLADAIGLSQQGISYLLNSAERVSAEIALKIDQFTDGEVSKEQLRPDIFGPASREDAAA